MELSHRLDGEGGTQLLRPPKEKESKQPSHRPSPGTPWMGLKGSGLQGPRFQGLSASVSSSWGWGRQVTQALLGVG